MLISTQKRCFLLDVSMTLRMVIISTIICLSAELNTSQDTTHFAYDFPSTSLKPVFSSIGHEAGKHLGQDATPLQNTDTLPQIRDSNSPHVLLLWKGTNTKQQENMQNSTHTEAAVAFQS